VFVISLAWVDGVNALIVPLVAFRSSSPCSCSRGSSGR